MVAKLTNMGVVIICINPLNSKFDIFLAACIFKTKYEISRPPHSRGILKSTGNVSTPPYYMSIQYPSRYSDIKHIKFSVSTQ